MRAGCRADYKTVERWVSQQKHNRHHRLIIGAGEVGELKVPGNWDLGGKNIRPYRFFGGDIGDGVRCFAKLRREFPGPVSVSSAPANLGRESVFPGSHISADPDQREPRVRHKKVHRYADCCAGFKREEAFRDREVTGHSPGGALVLEAS